MPATLAELLTIRTAEEVLEADLADAAADGLPSQGWQAKSMPRTVFAIRAAEQAESERQRALVAGAGFFEYAQDDWIDLKAAADYEATRYAGTKASHTCVVTDAGGGGVTKTAGTIWVRATTGVRFVNTANFTVPAGGSVSATFQAEAVGSAYNVQPGDISSFAVAMPGYTVENEDLGSGTSLTVVGSDDEDNETFIRRCRDKWAITGRGLAVGAWLTQIKEAAPTITRIAVDDLNPDGPCSLTFYLASATAPATPTELADVEAGVTIPLGMGNVSFQAAPEHTVELMGEVFGGDSAEILTALSDLSNEVGFGQMLYVEQIRHAIMGVAGVVNVVLTAPTVDTTYLGDVTFGTDGLVFS